MNGSDRSLVDVRARYVQSNAATLRWMLARPRLAGAFLNTKVNSLSLADYGDADGVRGPSYLYGWIQGRGLEAVATHAEFFETEDPSLAAELDAAGVALYHALCDLKRRDGHGYFCYDRDLNPVYVSSDGMLHQQSAADGVFTYSDAFFAKGLIAGAARYAPADVPEHLTYLAEVVDAIERRRFQMDERCRLSPQTALDEPEDFGPRMILLGAAGLLHRVGRSEHSAFADRFIAYILERHFDPENGLLRNVPGVDTCHVGHGIEFVGFALDRLQGSAEPALVQQLQSVLSSSFTRGFVGPGLCLSISAATGDPLIPYCPWWSLPETIRSAALCFTATGDGENLRIWEQADHAFFTHYWRGSLAYQTLTRDGPVDFVPATPDLDPGYHTGLSLLAAIHIADWILTRPIDPQATR
jgi:mannose/cellobiose epimerase-like protein (N-acyl-D-glucosamine 2-epimerase family)